MTCNTQTLAASHNGVASIGQRLSDIGKGLWRAYWRRRSERATIVQLHALQDYVLHDIGIDRSEDRNRWCAPDPGGAGNGSRALRSSAAAGVGGASADDGRHLIEQPMLGSCSAGPWPVCAIKAMAS